MLTHRSMLRRTASAYGGRTALVGEGGRTYTYRELEAETGRLAEALIGSGLEPGDRVVWLNDNCLEFLIAYFATAKANLLFAPLNYWLRPAELDQLVSLVDPACLMIGPGYLDVADSFGARKTAEVLVCVGGEREGWTSWDDLLSRPGSLAGIDEDENAIHEIVFTSGTTGQAKGVTRSQRARILDSAFAALGFELTRNDHLLFFGPQFHIGGGSVVGQLLIQGGTVGVMTFEAAEAARRIAGGVTYVLGVPAHYNLMFDAGVLDGVDLSKVRGCYLGGSVATRALFEKILATFPNAELVHGYGSTESGPHSLSLRGQDFLDHFGSLGLPIPGSEVKVVGSDGEPVQTGDIGELCVRSEAVMAGYFKRPELTANVLGADGWLKTGDLVRQDEDGYFYLAGRAKELIISGGENVYPKEVEDIIALHDSVAEVAVIGVPDPIYEERVVAVVRAHPGVEPPAATELIAFVRARLAGFKTPKELYWVDDFPRTAMGKILKEDLKRTYGGSVFEQATETAAEPTRA
jgi:fatty-acyl-CoA synthase